MGSNGSCTKDDCSNTICGKEKSRPENAIGGYMSHPYPKSDEPTPPRAINEVTGMDPYGTHGNYANGNGMRFGEFGNHSPYRENDMGSTYLTHDLAALRSMPADGLYNPSANANASSANSRHVIWVCQYCRMKFPSYEAADQHEQMQCPRRPGANVGTNTGMSNIGGQTNTGMSNIGGRKCKMGCGRNVAEGRNGQRFDTCCRGCATGKGHAPECNSRVGGGPSIAMSKPATQLRCGNCKKVFGVPPGHAQVKCPSCGMINACPTVGGPGGPSIPTNVYNQQIGMKNVPTNMPEPVASGKKKALLVGVNYFGAQAELRGCINDVHRMRGVIAQLYGFPTHAQAMRILSDDGKGHGMPTRQNILNSLRWLAEGAQPGDALFFHFSGHGAQQEDPNYAEEDGYDETICPCDFESAGMIVDDEIFDKIVAPLPSGAKLTAVMDCCHSGTGMDLPFILQSGRFLEEDNPCHSMGDVLMISGCQDEQCSSDGGGGYGRPLGAMTTALTNTLERNPRLTVAQLQIQLRNELSRGGFDQIPSITTSQDFDPNARMFSAVDGFIPNSNSQIGRQFRKRKHPKRENLLHGGLGDMLMAGAVGFMVVEMLEDADIACGLMMGGADLAMGGTDMAMTGGGMFGGMMGGGMMDMMGGGDMFGGGDDFW